MIEFKLHRLDKDTLDTIQALSTYELSMDDASNFANLIEELSKVVLNKNTKEIEITSNYAKRNEGGDFIRPTDENNQTLSDGFIVDNEKIPAYETEMKELLNTIITIDANKLDRSIFKDAKISAAGLLKLNFLFN